MEKAKRKGMKTTQGTRDRDEKFGADHFIHGPLIEPLNETAIRVVFGTDISPETNREVRKLTDLLKEQPLPGMIEAVPSFAVLTIFFDPLQVAEELPDGRSRTVMQDVTDWLQCLLMTDNTEKESRSRVIEIPVLYGGEYGPDLSFVAQHAGLSAEEVVAIHTEQEYPVYMIGFAPGFPYLGGMDATISAPRLETPRLSVPAGTVGIAGAQTGVYPVSTPGGWRLIGRTPTALFRPDQVPPSLLRAGDRVRFRQITKDEYVRLAEHRTDGANVLLTEESGIAKAEDKPSDSPNPGKGKFDHTGRVSEDSWNDGKEETAVPSISVLNPGLLTTLQDLGRPGYQQYGVTAGGAMDAYALRAANLMAGNAESEAALEITLAGPTLRFERETLIALAGADLAPSIGGVPLPMWRPVRVRAGAVLEFGPAREGCRAYLALAGGFAAPAALGSRGTDLRAGLGGLEGRALRAGDVLHARTSQSKARTSERAFGPLRSIAPSADFAAAPWHAAHGYVAGRPDWGDLHFPGSAQQVSRSKASPSAESAADVIVRFTRGTHFGLFDAPSREALLNAAFRIMPQSDRMGCRLSGPALRLEQPQELISEAVAPGTVQVPPGGNPIVLTADRQTTGGYPRIAQIISADLRLIAQLRPGQTLTFAEVSLREAEHLYIEQERELLRLRISMRLWRNG